MSDPRSRDGATPDAWDALAMGELTDEERAMLRALAEDDAQADAQLAAFTPLGDEFEERVAARIASTVRGEQGAPHERAHQAAAAEVSSIEARRTRGARPRWVIGGALAVAAALALAWIARPSPELELLSGWSTSLGAGARTERGAHVEHEIPRFAPETRLELTLTPPAAIEGPVEVLMFLVGPGDTREARDWAPPIERAPSGAMRVVGRTSALLDGVPAGRWSIAILVARTLPERETARAWASARDPRVRFVDLELQAVSGLGREHAP